MGGPPCSGTSHGSLFLYFSLITRKRRERCKGKGQSQPEEPRGCQTKVPDKEPQSRLSRRNRERRDPEQVQSSPAVHSPLSVTRETESQRRERHRRKLRRGPRVGWDWFSFSFPSILPS